MLPAAGLVIALPLAAAVLSERWIEAGAGRVRWRERLAWWPVPLLALVLFLVAATQVASVARAAPLLGSLVPVFVAFLLAAGLIARGLAQLFRLPRDSGRTLAFSLGTRNSFLVLPIALALPNGGETVVVIVLQSLVELFGMIVYLWWIPRRLFR